MNHQTLKFLPCVACAKLPMFGSLCDGCRHNKKAIVSLTEESSRLRGEAEGSRLLALELADAVRQRGHIDWCPAHGDTGAKCACNYERAIDARKKLTKGT